jgi:hypothetical protein
LAKRDNHAHEREKLLQELQASNNDVLEIRKQLDEEKEKNAKLAAENVAFG